MTERPVTACLPARNEKVRLPGLLARLCSLPPRADYELAEIIVCANGCTDGTEDTVAEWAVRDPRVRLVVSRPGKPSACNRLLASAMTDRLVFFDCDVMPTPYTIPRLVLALDRHPAAAVVAGADRPRGGDPIVRLVATPLRHDYLCGRCYLVHRPRLLRRMEACGGADGGLTRMPENLLGEDYWLWGLCLPDAVAYAPAARVWFHPGRWRDRITILARDEVAKRQIAAEHPTLAARLSAQRSLSRQLRRVGRAARSSPSGQALSSILGLALRRALRLVAAGRIRRLERLMMEQANRIGFAEVLGTVGRARPD